MTNEVSLQDLEFLRRIRDNIGKFLESCSREYATGRQGKLLDIAPQEHEGARPYFPADIEILTLDIDPHSGCDYIGDICKTNGEIDTGSLDFVVCTEVLEHVRQPFSAVDEIWRMLAPGGHVFASTPFNFRIHGPLPDCWRFTEHGLRELFRDFYILRLDALEDENRFLMPIHYTLVARKPMP